MSVNSEAIRVVIADDEPGMRMIMRKMIEKAEGFTLCGEADNGPDLLKLVERYKPQVCFLDVEMPGMTGLGMRQGDSGYRPAHHPCFRDGARRLHGAGVRGLCV